MSNVDSQAVDPVSVPQIEVERIGGVPCVQCRKPMRLDGLQPLSSGQCPHCGTVFSVPCRIDEYVLLRPLWEQAGVWMIEALGKDKQTPVLMQVFRGSDHSQTRLRYFLRDVQRISKLRHIHIVHVVAMNTNQSQPYVVMERAQGHQLSKYLMPGRLMREVNALNIALAIAEALAAADQKKYVHGDVSASNVMVDEVGHVTVFNFGWDRILRFKTEEGIVGGNPLYVAPEKVRGEAASRSSDIYSLGAVFYHMLAGNPPFQGEDDEETALMRLDHLPPDINDFRDDLNGHTTKLVDGLLQPKKSQRYQDYVSIIRDIRKAVTAVQHEARAAGVTAKQETDEFSELFGEQQTREPAGYHGADPTVFNDMEPVVRASTAAYSKRRSSRRNDPTLMIIVGVALVVGLIVMVVLLANADSWRHVNYREPARQNTPRHLQPLPGMDVTPEHVKRQAYDEAKYFMQDYLDNPGTANFLPFTDERVTVTKYPSGHYMVRGYVTSQDDGGQTVRRRYNMEVWPTNKAKTRWKAARPQLVVE